jgi:hypothetical protein
MKPLADATVTGSLIALSRPRSAIVARLAEDPRIEIEGMGPKGWFAGRCAFTRAAIPSSGTPRVPIVLRESGSHLLIASNRSGNDARFINLFGSLASARRPVVSVTAIVSDLARQPGKYCLSSVHARVNGYGRSIRTVALYGDDLAEANLFGEILPRLTPFFTMLREIATRRDVLGIGSRGEITFFYHGARSLFDAEGCLRYLKAGGYLNWGEHANSNSTEEDVNNDEWNNDRANAGT